MIVDRQEFRTCVVSRQDEAVVLVQGAVDLATASSFEEALRRAAALDHRAVLVDLTRVYHFESSGISALLRVWREEQPRGTRFRVRVGSRTAERILRLAGVARVMALEPAGSPVEPILTSGSWRA